jgi:hypothetical protein
MRFLIFGSRIFWCINTTQQRVFWVLDTGGWSPELVPSRRQYRLFVLFVLFEPTTSVTRTTSAR